MRVVAGEAARTEVERLAARGAVDLATVEPKVATIVNGVRRERDAALRRYAGQFDGLADGQPLRVPPEEIRAAWDAMPEDFRQALQAAATNIRRYCDWQKPKPWIHAAQAGLRVGQIVCPLEAVGCYVPGGRYPLPSTLLMTAIPAQVVGVNRIVAVSPHPAPQTLAAAALLGIEEFYRIGGAQAIAALAYGTETVARVDKIVGPGNLYVTAAKKMVAFDCAIDFLAGPTEVVLVSHRGDAGFLASDLVAQAEHDPDATAIFVTTSPSLAEAVVRETVRLSEGNPTAQRSLAENGIVLVAASREEAMEFANKIAAEHLTVPREELQSVRNAGAVFVGDYSPQAMGDYASGPNHVLPTGAVARYRGGLGVFDYVKIISVQESTGPGLQKLAPTITTLADAEGLRAHAESVRIRCAKLSRKGRSRDGDA
jgi:histidinol dehydrogenase